MACLNGFFHVFSRQSRWVPMYCVPEAMPHLSKSGVWLSPHQQGRGGSTQGMEARWYGSLGAERATLYLILLFYFHMKTSGKLVSSGYFWISAQGVTSWMYAPSAIHSILSQGMYNSLWDAKINQTQPVLGAQSTWAMPGRSTIYAYWFLTSSLKLFMPGTPCLPVPVSEFQWTMTEHP